MKNRGFVQITLALGLAVGLMLSPLHAATVGYGAHLRDETPSAPIDDLVDTTADEGEPVESSPQPEGTDAFATEGDSTPEAASTPEPETTSAPPEETLESSPVAETAEPTPGTSTETMEAATLPVEATSNPTELPSETALPTVTEAAGFVSDVSPTPEPEIMEETALVSEATTPEPEEDTAENSSLVSGKILIQYDSSTNLDDLTSGLIQLGFTVLEPAGTGWLVLDVPSGSEADSAVLVQSLYGVQTASPIQVATALDLIPNDPEYSDQQYLTMIDAAGGWEYTTGSSSVIIAVIDTGVDYTNLEFAGCLVAGYDFVNHDYDPFDDNGHGTHVAGIIAATGNNNYGIAGLNWQAMIMPIKVLDASGYGTDLNVYYGILYAVDNGATIINLSLALDSYSALVAAAVDYANSRGVTVVAASGNTNSSVNYPAALSQVIAVGSVDDSENRAYYSNYGSELDVVAPGNNILSTEGSSLTYRTGTSMAAPQVTGLASLLKSIYPLTPVQIKTTIESTTKDLGTTGWDQYFGNGLIQVRRAIEWLLARLAAATPRETADEIPPTPGYPTFTPTFTPTLTPTATPAN